MRATVVMPWRSTPDRIAAYRRCAQFWVDHRYQIVVADSDSCRRFNRSQARNNAVRLTSTDLVIIADADTRPADISQINEALEVASNGLVVWPYSSYKLLPADATEVPDLAAVEPIRTYPLRHRPGGLIVISRTAYDTVGGFDEQFGAGWGYEDAAFRLTCQTLIGAHNLTGVVYAFDHNATRIRHPQNRRRFWWYQQAARQGADEMRRFLD